MNFLQKCFSPVNASSPDSPQRPTLILDTNAVLDVFVFAKDPLLEPLRNAVREREVDVITVAACATELDHVLKLDKVPATAEVRERAAADFAAFVRVIDMPAKTGPVPRCADRDDQVFIDLAVGVGATWLLSRDKKVLKLRKRFAKLELPTQIMHPLDWCASVREPV